MDSAGPLDRHRGMRTGITGETLLVNGGRSKARIRDRLESMGIKDLDAIALTHPDADHVAGLVEVLEMFLVERIYLNGGNNTGADTPVGDDCRRGQSRG